MKQCPACGANNSPDAPSCSICGAALGQVSSNVAARTLFGMPAVKIDRPAPPPEPEPEPAALSRTRPGFRALGAVELDHSVGSLNIVPDIDPQRAGRGADKSARVEPEPEPDVGMKQTLFGAPSPFKTDAESEPPAPVRAAPIESTRLGMPSLNITPPSAPAAPLAPAAAKAPPAADYQTLLGPPQPLAEVLKARDAARQAAPPADDYRTLVGPPGSIADAARARDLARVGAPATHDVPPSREPTPAAPSIIVDQQAFAHSLAAENAGPSVIVDPGLDDEPVIVDDPPVRGPGSALRPLPGDADPSRGEPPPTAEVKRPTRATERAAAARLAQAIEDSDVAIERPGPGWIWLIVLIVLAAIAFAVWFTREARTGDARLDASPAGAIASAPGARAPQ